MINPTPGSTTPAPTPQTKARTLPLAYRTGRHGDRGMENGEWRMAVISESINPTAHHYVDSPCPDLPCPFHFQVPSGALEPSLGASLPLPLV